MKDSKQVLVLHARLMIAAVLVGVAIGALAASLFVPTSVMAQQKPSRIGLSEQERLVELEQRMARVEKQTADLQKRQGTVKAPFEILGSSGRAIMSVSENANDGINVRVLSQNGGGFA